MGKITIDKERCKGCHLCIVYCSHGLIKVSKNTNAKGAKPAEFSGGEDCTGCTMCAIVCPDCAIEVFK